MSEDLALRGPRLGAGWQPSAEIDRDSLAAEIRDRRRRLDEAMRRHDLDGVVVASEANCVYLTGYQTTFWGNKSKPFAVVLAAGEQPRVVCHLGEVPSVERDAVDVSIEPYAGPVNVAATGVQLDYQLPAAAEVARVISSLGLRRIGFELSWHFLPGFTPGAFDQLRNDLGAAEICDASAAIWSLRRAKSEWEIAQMRVAVAVCEQAHRAFEEAAHPGLTERELNRLLIVCAFDAGAERVGYSGIVAGIDRAPLGGPTDRRWERDQLLMADICLQVNGYFADFNRILAGAPQRAAALRAYSELVEALEQARAVLRPGASVRTVADALTGGAAGPYARVGHGLGLEMPEPPSLSLDDDSVLIPGEVLCLEPNRHVAGVGWLVGEEEVVVTSDGFELLSPPFPATMPEVG